MFYGPSATDCFAAAPGVATNSYIFWIFWIKFNWMHSWPKIGTPDSVRCICLNLSLWSAPSASQKILSWAWLRSNDRNIDTKKADKTNPNTNGDFPPEFVYKPQISSLLSLQSITNVKRSQQRFWCGQFQRSPQLVREFQVSFPSLWIMIKQFKPQG